MVGRKYVEKYCFTYSILLIMSKKFWISAVVVAILLIPVFGGYLFHDEEERALPTIKITLPEDTPELNREDWNDCRLRVKDEHGESDFATPYLSVQGRGHSTFAKPKRPYNFKLDRERSLLGLPARQRLVMLAGFFDHALIRNALAHEVARQTSLAPTTPHGCFVNLEIDGEYLGIYYLCERVRDLVDDDAMLLELDAYAMTEDKDVFRTAELQLPVSVKQPDKLSEEQLAEVENWINQIEANPVEGVDFDTFADYFLVQELCRNGELNGPRSCFMHSLPNGHLAAGPVWDFDLAFNSVYVDEKNDLRPLRFEQQEGWRHLGIDSLYNGQSLWYGRLLQDVAFVDHLKERWQLLKPRFEGLTTYIDSLDNLIREDAIIDQQMWNAQEPARFDSCTTYHSAIAVLRSTYEQRIVKLDSLIKAM